jgi:hypothetical protein
MKEVSYQCYSLDRRDIGEPDQAGVFFAFTKDQFAEVGIDRHQDPLFGNGFFQERLVS